MIQLIGAMNKKYYLHNGVEQQGPFTIEELKVKGITKETPVWFEGITDWVKAGEVDELLVLFQTTPPPFKSSVNKTSVDPLKGRTANFSFVKILGIILGLIGFWIVIQIATNYYASVSHAGNSYHERIKTIEELEKEDPAKFLQAGGTYNETFWGENFKVHGSIRNNATVANYKDVIVTVVYYTETNTEIKRENYTIYKFVPAHSTAYFELKVNKPQVCRTLGLKAINATPY